MNHVKLVCTNHFLGNTGLGDCRVPFNFEFWEASLEAMVFFSLIFYKRERDRKGEGEKNKKEIHQCESGISNGCLLHLHYQGSSPQPRQMP